MNSVQELLLAFVKNPTRESFLDLRTAHLAQEGLNPYDSSLDTIPALLNDGQYEQVHHLIRDHLTPNYLLSPAVHLQLGYSLEKMGQTAQAESARYIAYHLLLGIEMSGDGVEKKPYLVTRTSDEYDFLNYRQKSFAQQSLVQKDGRHYDHIKTQEGDSFWFDITEVFELLNRQFSIPPA